MKLLYCARCTTPLMSAATVFICPCCGAAYRQRGTRFSFVADLSGVSVKEMMQSMEVTLSNVVADVLLPFFEGLESRYQIPKLFLQSHINGELSKEATKVLRCTVIVFSETGKSGSRIVIQFQSVISRFFSHGWYLPFFFR